MDTKSRSLSSGIIGRLEQCVIDTPALWSKLSPVGRYIAVALLVTLMGLLSPSCLLGGYRICLVDLSQGLALMICLLAGPRYAISAFVALCYVYSAKHYAILCDNIVIHAALSAVLMGTVPWLMRRFGIGLNDIGYNRKTISFLLIVLLVPLIMLSLLYVSGLSEMLEVQSPLGGTFLYHKFVFQTIVAPLLGMAVFFVIGQPLQNLSPRSAFVLVRIVLLIAIGLATILLVFNSQLETERSSVFIRLSNQALSIRNAIEQQLSLAFRSACNIEYSTVDCYLGKISESELQKRCMVVQDEHTPWAFLESILADPTVSTGNSLQDYAHYRLVAMSVSRDESAFNDTWEIGSYLNENPAFQSVLRTIKDVNSRKHKLVFDNQFILSQQGDVFVVERGCFYKRQLVGIALLGLNIGDFVREVVSQLDIDDIGLKVKYYQQIDGSNSALIPCYSNTEYAFSGIFSVYTDVAIDCGKTVKVLQFSVSDMPERGLFLLHSLEEFVIYLVCLLIAVVMARGLFEQYCLVDERALEQVRAKETLDQRYEIMASNMCESLAIVDLDGMIVTANRAEIEYFGCSLEEAVGKSLHDFSHRGLPCLQTHDCPTSRYFAELRQRLLNGEDVEDLENMVVYDNVYIGNDQRANFRAIYSHIRDNKGQILIVILGRNADEKLRLQKVRSDYVATLSHDMRTPLACIKGTLEMFAKFAPKMITEQGYSAKGKEMLDLGRRNVGKLNQLINDVLLCDSVENETLNIHKSVQEVAPIVQHVVESMQESAAKQGLKLVTGELEGQANVDAIRLDQVLSNLIGNAIKYSRKGEEIFVNAKIYPAEQAIVFRVKDRGVGIPEAKLATIFERYEVVNSDSTRMYGGLGLGLTICRGLVKAMGGDIWVESEEGEGSTFSFTLPLYVAAEGAETGDAGK